MFKLTHPLPHTCYVACSGGVDSIVAAHWLHNSNKVRGLVYVHHNTGEYADQALEVVKNFASKLEVEFKYHMIEGSPPARESKEDWWRKERYVYLHSLEVPVILGHHLDDCVEEYIMCSLVRGRLGTIPYANLNCIRPFRLWKKRDILGYARSNRLEWIDDPSNNDTNYKRNLIRQNILPQALELNVGLYSLVERLIKEGNIG